MAWDFYTEPEFEKKLERLRSFVRGEICALDMRNLTYGQIKVTMSPLEVQVEAEGCSDHLLIFPTRRPLTHR